jgi:MFS family permease
LSGSAVNFLNIYATRLGATGFEIGLLTGVGALVSLILAIPAGHWISRRPIGKAVFWSSVVYRLGFLLWIPLPWLFGNAGQVSALIVLSLLMAIPLTPLAVGFSALFASAVPDEYRAHVAGIRNVVLSVTFILSSLGSGYVLARVPFPLGYQIVFAIGFLGAMLSSLHLYFVRPLAEPRPDPAAPRPGPASNKAEQSPGLLSGLRMDVWSTHYRSVLLVMMGFHLAQYLALPLFPLYQVHILHLTDDQIGIGSALFYLVVLVASTQLGSIVQKFGHRGTTAAGVIGMGFYPVFLAISHTPLHFYAISAIGGLSWALASGGYANYVLENIPAFDRPAYLAWYNVILNASILSGSLIGPLIANGIGLIPALLAFAALRWLAGAAMWKWG